MSYNILADQYAGTAYAQQVGGGGRHKTGRGGETAGMARVSSVSQRSTGRRGFRATTYWQISTLGEHTHSKLGRGQGVRSLWVGGPRGEGGAGQGEGAGGLFKHRFLCPITACVEHRGEGFELQQTARQAS
jgi:hypothetical protein